VPFPVCFFLSSIANPLFYPLSEIYPLPESWVKKDGNLVFYRQAKSGGHFAALEVPEVLLKDVEDFVEQVWERKSAGDPGQAGRL
jgi:microsomal epoxide hydrolase